MNNDTIFALSSGHGKSGVAVIRISGQNLSDFAEKILGCFGVEPRHAYFATLADNTGEPIDQCIITYFTAPHSFTGEDVIEIASHGAPAVIEKVFDFLSSNNMRMATPGEFSRRAFYNNKMDLADIDGLAALLDAQTDIQRKSALCSMMGRDSKIYDTWRTQMIEIAAYAAAILDYDADDLPQNIGTTIVSKIKKLYSEIDGALSRYAAARAVRSGFNIALVGAPNVGKSSLFNQIVGAQRAIVSSTPGTTRDVVSANLDIDGYLVNISDTAGLRDDTDDKIEKIGIERTNAEIKNADLVLRIVSAEQSAEFRVQSSELVEQINEKIAELTTALDACEFRAAIVALRSLYAIGNEYMTAMEPWTLVKNGDMAAAGAVLNTCFQLIDLYARVSAPFIPDAAKKMQNIFTNKHDLSWPERFESRIANGEDFSVPENLFNRIDDETVAQLTEKYAPKAENKIVPIVAKITAVQNHESRDNLHILTVNDGAHDLQIVCGAPNVRVGLIGVLAPVGCVLPGQKKPIGQRTVAGVESFGMMCSAAELGVGDDGDNIIELSENAKIGEEYKG